MTDNTMAKSKRKNKDPRPLRRKKIEQTRIPHKTGNERSCSVMVGNYCSTNGSRHVVFVFVFTCNTCFQFVICLIPLDNIVFGLDLISNMSLYICYFKIVHAAALVFIRDLHI